MKDLSCKCKLLFVGSFNYIECSQLTNDIANIPKAKGLSYSQLCQCVMYLPIYKFILF